MNRCPKCNKQFSVEVKFCPICGYESNNQQNDTEFYICPQCHIEYSYKIDHCTNCGYCTSNYKNKIRDINNESLKKATINIPMCPTCQSTNIRKISGTKKVTSIIGFGILSDNIGKTFECLNCKYKW